MSLQNHPAPACDAAAELPLTITKLYSYTNRPRTRYTVSKCGREGAARLVFEQKDRVGLAFTVERSETGGALRRKDAEEYAFRELEKAGIPPSNVQIEAFENKAGWLVFCTVEREAETVYIHFENKNDFLDAICAHGKDGVTLRGWESNGYTVRISGPRRLVASYASRLSEYGNPFEAPEGYALHLDEQSRPVRI